MAATYTNNPNPRAKRRMVFDINSIKNDTDEIKFQKGIYFDFKVDESFDCNYNMLIIGPEDSPYVGGFYGFDGKFPDNYPYYPMTMKTLTQGGGIRKHPNLYTGGKCCFSFLGTWQGPPWTACQNPDTVGVSMRSVLTNNPIINEPGWEKKNDSKTKLYEDMIIYFNLRYAVVEFLTELRKKSGIGYKFRALSNRVYEHFIYNYDKGFYQEKLSKIKSYHGQNLKSPVYGFSVEFNIKYVDSQLKSLYSEIVKENGHLKSKIPSIIAKTSIGEVDVPINSSVETTDDISKKSDDSSVSSSESSTTLKIKKKYTRKAPKEKAKNFELNHELKGLNGKMWVVKTTKTGQKRWYSV